ncbi:4-hydroxy-3-methylbut-2-enyl diphosphate reductase [Streptomyces sp. NPDC002754]
MGSMTATPGPPPATTPSGDAPRRSDNRRVLLAAPRGYCAGVDRAVIAVEKALEQYGAPIYVRHEIVHNKYVVQTLERKGAIFVEQTEEVPEGSIVMFSAHGVAPTVHEEAERGKLATIDATCPLVTKVHKEAVRYANDDFDILLIGHEGHEEVIGTSGEAPDHITLVDGPEDVAKVEVRDPEKVVWLSQTTLSVDETMETVDALKGKFPGLISPPSDDICYATQNRQLAVKQMGAESDLVIVVGSRNSSNSVRLVEVAKLAGAREAYLVDYASEIDESWLDGVTTIGVTSGASVPDVLVEEVLEYLSKRDFADVEIVKAAEESITFSLPKELRRDLRAEAATLVGEAGESASKE